MPKILKVTNYNDDFVMVNTRKRCLMIITPTDYQSKFVLMTPDIERYFTTLASALSFVRKRNLLRIGRKRIINNKKNNIEF